MPGSSRITLSLDLDLASEPIEGEVRLENGSSMPFTGWLGLTSALERATVAGSAPITSREDPHVR